MTITQTDDRPIVLTSTGTGSEAQDSTPTIVAAPDPVSVSTRPTFTITDAATACAVSRKTITRKLSDLADHGAAKDSDGVWRIPVEALLAVGLHPGRSLPREASPVPAAAAAETSRRSTIPAPDPAIDTVTIPRDRWDDLRIRLARAEAEAAERALALADARLALRALTAGPASYAQHHGAVESGEPLVADSGARALSAQHEQPSQSVPASVNPVPSGVVSGPGAGAAPETVSAPTTTGAADDARAESGAAEDLASARTQAAQRGGYVPAAGTAPRKKRWWRSA